MLLNPTKYIGSCHQEPSLVSDPCPAAPGMSRLTRKVEISPLGTGRPSWAPSSCQTVALGPSYRLPLEKALTLLLLPHFHSPAEKPETTIKAIHQFCVTREGREGREQSKEGTLKNSTVIPILKTPSECWEGE